MWGTMRLEFLPRPQSSERHLEITPGSRSFSSRNSCRFPGHFAVPHWMAIVINMMRKTMRLLLPTRMFYCDNKIQENIFIIDDD